MKKLFLLVTLSAAGFSAPAADNARTNYVAASGPFRVVGGQVYNVEKSRLWRVVNGKMFSQAGAAIVVEEIQTDWSWKRVMLCGYPVTNRPPVDGDRIFIRAMEVGVTNWNGETMRLMDCGKPYLIPVVTTNGPAATKRSAKAGSRP